jgi:hypothetical protein
MINGQEIVFQWVPGPWLTMVVSFAFFFFTTANYYQPTCRLSVGGKNSPHLSTYLLITYFLTIYRYIGPTSYRMSQ